MDFPAAVQWVFSLQRGFGGEGVVDRECTLSEECTKLAMVGSECRCYTVAMMIETEGMVRLTLLMNVAPSHSVKTECLQVFFHRFVYLGTASGYQITRTTRRP